jgi:ketosteroid isomerase-like protein
MKFYLLTIILITAYACSKARSTDEQAIRAVINKQIREWNNGNIPAFMETYAKTDSLMFIGSKGITYGWDSTLAKYQRNYPDKAAMGKLTFELKEVKQLSEKYYYVVGKFNLEREKGNVSGHFDLLFEKINGQWFIIADHTSWKKPRNPGLFKKYAI